MRFVVAGLVVPMNLRSTMSARWKCSFFEKIFFFSQPSILLLCLLNFVVVTNFQPVVFPKFFDENWEYKTRPLDCRKILQRNDKSKGSKTKFYRHCYTHPLLFILLLFVFSACGRIRTGNTLPDLTAYAFPCWLRVSWERVDCLWHHHYKITNTGVTRGLFYF